MHNSGMHRCVGNHVRSLHWNKRAITKLHIRKVFSMTAIDIKAAFFDIDGTLTSFTTHVVPQSTIDALRALQANGVKIFICTGRPPAQMSVVLNTIPVDFDGIVGFNGQYCVDGSGFLEKQTLDATDVATIVRWLDEHEDIVACIGEEDYVYFNHSNDQMRRTWASLGKTAPDVFFDDPRVRTAEHETFQMSPYISRDQEAELLSLLPNTRGVRWHPDFVDLIPADGGKDRGIQRFLDHYGWSKEQTISFGDGGNDVDMLRFTGIGVAMGNATEEPKAVADYVTDDVDHDGIWNALKHFDII